MFCLLQVLKFKRNMKSSQKLLTQITLFEGYSEKAYKCSAGVWTCGYGHTRGVTKSTVCNRTQAKKWLEEDLRPCEDFCNTIKEIDTQGKFDSCVDFCFNLGVDAFKKSTLLKLIRKKEKNEVIKKEFEKWVYAKGQRLNGLVKRRKWESQRWDE